MFTAPIRSVRSTCVFSLALSLTTLACGEAPSKETYTYKSVDGIDILADVHRSAKDNGVTLLWLHGGGLVIGNRVESVPEEEIAYFVDAGFTVVNVDYRLAPETKLKEIHRDVADAYAWVRNDGPTLFGANPDRIVVVGQSAGGYLALSAGHRLSPRPAAIVSFYGYGRINGDWVNGIPNAGIAVADVDDGLTELLIDEESPAAGRPAYNAQARASGTWTADVVGDECAANDASCLSQYNPEDHVTQSYPPTIFVHGDKDEDVPFEESRRMAKLLKAAGVEHEIARARHRIHAFDTRGINVDVAVLRSFERVTRFLEEQLGMGPGRDDNRAR